MVLFAVQASMHWRRLMSELPTGTVTFLFTDIEGSTALAQQYPAALPALLARHHAILHEVVEAYFTHYPKQICAESDARSCKKSDEMKLVTL